MSFRHKSQNQRNNERVDRLRPSKNEKLRSANSLPLNLAGIWPAWSPDGRRLAYWKADDQGLALWLMELDGFQSTRLTPHFSNDPLNEYTPTYPYDLSPQWSPDGTALAFVASPGDIPEAFILYP